MRKVLTCVGARPNFIKITQLDKYFSAYPDIEHKLLHTRQHFDYEMTDIFFKELAIKQPDIFLDIKHGSQINIISEIMAGFKPIVKDYAPDLVLVPGDVHSSFACAFVASRCGFRVGHIESGLRSFDRTMPEEMNRILIDDLADLLFVTEESGRQNLLREQKPADKIHFSGNTMIDSLKVFLKKAEASQVKKTLGIDGDYLLLTLHRPTNVDNPENMMKIAHIVQQAAEFAQLVFPIHPRTKKNFERFGLLEKLKSNPRIQLTKPLGYLDFLNLLKDAKVVLTDSGGIQEETTYLGVPCLTLRENTERPITVDIGTNTITGLNAEKVVTALTSIFAGQHQQGSIPEKWDGNASQRIVETIADSL